MNGLAIETGPAVPPEAGAVADAVTALVRELRGDPTHTIPGLADAVVAAINGQASCRVLVARHSGQVVGILNYSIQDALRLAGPYFLIQELWVTKRLRSRGVAAALLDEMAKACAAAGVTRVEVCLPSPRFADYALTLNFYERNGFRSIGPRVIKDLP